MCFFADVFNKGMPASFDFSNDQYLYNGCRELPFPPVALDNISGSFDNNRKSHFRGHAIKECVPPAGIGSLAVDNQMKSASVWRPETIQMQLDIPVPYAPSAQRWLTSTAPVTCRRCIQSCGPVRK
jgi:hypothetical protein